MEMAWSNHWLSTANLAPLDRVFGGPVFMSLKLNIMVNVTKAVEVTLKAMNSFLKQTF